MSEEENKSKAIGSDLIKWHATVERELPWKETTDPYKIWISEIILQQTRVAQGRDYYERFVKELPTLRTLAEATEDKVLALWKGLGYYTRARNLHKAAKLIMSQHQGVFPTEHRTILALPGIGPYTAAAIASFAFKQPYAVVDGNVYRVLSRYYGESLPVDTTEGKKKFTVLAAQSLLTSQPDIYNQAIMDLGALICVPRPKCESCPLADRCDSSFSDIALELPIKSKKTKSRDRYFNYLIATDGKSILLRKRTKKDIWQGLYEPILIETEKKIKKISTMKKELENVHFSSERLLKIGAIEQQLSHQKIHAQFYKIENINISDYDQISIEQLSQLAMPRCVDIFLKQYFKY